MPRPFQFASLPCARLAHRQVGRAAVQLVVVLLSCLFLLGAGDDANARFDKLGHKLMCSCGYCNQILLECNHVGCEGSTRMRGELLAAIQRGDSDDLVLQAFVQKYGAVVLAAPTTAGFNRVAWLMPFIALFAGLTLVVLVVRAWHGGRTSPTMSPAAPSEEMDSYRRRARQETEL